MTPATTEFVNATLQGKVLGLPRAIAYKEHIPEEILSLRGNPRILLRALRRTSGESPLSPRA